MLVAVPGVDAAKTKPDRTSPGLRISAPSAGATVNGKITIAGSASDNVAVARVDVSVDGGPYIAAAGTASWSAPLDTTAYANGSHSVTARAVDKSGNSSLSSVSFTISNALMPSDTTAPEINIRHPSQGAAVDRQLSVEGIAADDTVVSKVEVKLDDGSFQPATGTGSWAAQLDASAAPDGPHVITARATDAAGNASSTSESVLISDEAVPAPDLSAGTIGGFAFQETDRDGVFESTEQPLAGMYVYLFNSSGVYLGNATTDAAGWYRFTGLADGVYRVELAPISWNPLRDEWVADTTGTIFPRREVALTDSARADFGSRRIRRSTDPSAPTSSHVGASGLTVKSYNDAVSANEIYSRLMSGVLVGAEARYVTVRFDLLQAGHTATLAVQSNGVYTDYRATSDVTWASWLRGDGELFHEYGHAWSMYYTYMVQADSSLKAYLDARGLSGDQRVGSSYAWMPGEMIAEDYRQLFGTASAQADSQMNRDIPLAKDVPGLRTFLSGAFMQSRVY
jgi:hypothetical protein